MDLPYDKSKNQRRAFCFITFETEEAAEKAVGDSGKQTLNGKEVGVKTVVLLKGTSLMLNAERFLLSFYRLELPNG